MYLKKNGFTDHEYEAIQDVISHIEAKIELSAHKARSAMLMAIIPWMAANTIGILSVAVRIWH